MKTKLVLIIVITRFIMFGCYLPSTHEKVNYNFNDFQTSFKVSIPNAEKINLFVERLFDVRNWGKDNVIGEANVGYLNKNASVTIEGSVVELSTRTLRDAFSTAGFNVVDNENNADLVFKGRINTFWVIEIRDRIEYSQGIVEFDVVLIDKARMENIWYDVKRSVVKSEPASTDTTLQNIKVINAAFNRIINFIVNDSELRTVVDSFIQSNV
jgi:hypothetical protein